MTHDQFDALLERRIDRMRATLASKAGEYAAGGDRLHNFNRASVLRGKPAPSVLLGLLIKHWVSLEDLVDGLKHGPLSEAVIDEKVGDAVNYLVLLEAVLKA